MNTNQQLEIQAYVDGQLRIAEARRVERQLATDPVGAALAADLRLVRGVIREGEPLMPVPETREFYFSQIQRRIEAEEKIAAREEVRTPKRSNWMRSFLIPAVGVACLAAVAVLTTRETARPFIPGEVDIASDQMSAITFRSEANRMTVVYLFDKRPAAATDTNPNSSAD
jgi:anti-sigma factor RsiW